MFSTDIVSAHSICLWYVFVAYACGIDSWYIFTVYSYNKCFQNIFTELTVSVIVLHSQFILACRVMLSIHNRCLQYILQFSIHRACSWSNELPTHWSFHNILLSDALLFLWPLMTVSGATPERLQFPDWRERFPALSISLISNEARSCLRL